MTALENRVKVALQVEKELETEEDVDDYLQSLREVMVKHIQKNHDIILD